MSLVGFKIENHPQQVGKRGARDSVDERWTPQWLFDQYNARFNFTLDAAANSVNAKVATFFDLESDGLTQPWAPHSVWCNPPYSNIGPWCEKAHRELDAGCPAIVMLLPANRTEQGWWQDHIEPFRDRPDSRVRVEFLRRRLNFASPGNPSAKYHGSASFGCCIVIFQN